MNIHKCLYVMVSSLLLLGFWVGTTMAAMDDVAVICHKNVPIEHLESGEIQQIFLGRKTRWPNSQKINFVILKGGVVHSDFLSAFISKTPSQYTVFWKKMIFTGQAKPPRSFDTPEEVIEFVSHTPGAIGYIPVNLADGNVKIVAEIK